MWETIAKQCASSAVYRIVDGARDTPEPCAPASLLNVEIHQSAIVLLFLLSAYGWGRLARPWLDRRVLKFHSLTAILGLTERNLIGGVLNLARPPMLLAVVLIG